MKSFRDNEGREWIVAVNVGTIKRVKASLGVDLLSAVEGELVEKLISDPILLVDIIYVLCADQAEKRGVSDEQFGQAMAGDAIDAATEAMLGELVSFFPRQKRAVYQRAVTTMQTAQTKAMARAMAWMESGALDRQIDEQISKALPMPGESSTS